MKKDNKSTAVSLRQKAEELLKKKLLKTSSKLSEADAQKLIHELGIHQIELELQNEELMLAKEQAEVASEKYSELYDFAPSGYFTLSKEGKIIELNLNGSNMLGKERSQLKNSLFGFFVSDDAKPIFNHFLEKVFTGKAKELCEVAITTNGNSLIYVQLTGIADQNGQQCLISATDISQRKQAEEERLESSEERFRLLYENAKIGLYRTTPDGTIVLANRALVAMLGYQSFDELAKRNLEQDGFETSHQRKAFLEKIEQTGEVENFETTWIRQDRTPVFVRESAQAIRDSHGNTMYYDGTAEDITARKQAEQALRDSEARYHLLFEGSADGIIIADIETKTFKYANPALCRMLGYTEEELTTLSIADIHPKQDLQWIIAVFESQARGEKTLASDIPCLRKDGSIVYADINTTTITIDGRPCAVGLFRDITERKRAEEALYYERTLFRTVIDLMPDAIYVKDVEGRKTLANLREVQLTGKKSEAELIGKTDFELYPESVAKHSLDEDKLIIQSGKPILDIESLLIDKDGQVHWQVGSKVPLRDMHGHITGIVGFSHDTTKRKQAEETLKKAHEEVKRTLRFNEALLLAIPTPVFYKDKEGRYLGCNNAFSQFMGIAPEDINGKTADELWPTEHVQVYHNHDLELMRNPAPQIYEFKVRDKDGLERPVIYSKDVFRDDNNQVAGIVGAFLDITDRKRAEQALIDSETRARALIDAIPDLIFRLDKQGVYLDYKANKEDLAYQTESIMGKKNRDIMPTEFADLIDEKIRLTLQTGQMQVFEYQLPLPNKGISEFEARMVPGNPDEVIAIVRDVTERRRAEEALRDSEQRYRLLIETVNEGILVAQNGFLKFVNPMMQVITGFTQEELLTLPFTDHVYPEDREILMSNHMKRLKGEPFLPRYQFRFVKKDGSTRRIEMNGIVIEWEGQPATLNMLTDITERVQAEEEIRLKNEQLLKLNAEKDKFFSIIAHDLRGPFSGFLGLTELMTDDLPDLTMDEIQEFSVNMRNSATNLYRLLENLLQWSRMQQGSIPFDPEVILLHPVVDESITMLLDIAKNKGIKIVYDIPDYIEVCADNNMLQTVIRNLVSNAVKFTPKGGKISVSAKVLNDNSVEISIKDTGIGMSQTLIDNLFKLNVNTNRKGTEGEPSTGLGLILCKEFVEKQDGKIWVESEVENLSAGKAGGTTFYFTLRMST